MLLFGAYKIRTRTRIMATNTIFLLAFILFILELKLNVIYKFIGENSFKGLSFLKSLLRNIYILSLQK